MTEHRHLEPSAPWVEVLTTERDWDAADPDLLLPMLSQMVLIRTFEEYVLELAAAGLIDEYTFVVHPVVAGHGPTLLAGLRDRIPLELVDRQEFRSGATAVRYRPRA